MRMYGSREAGFTLLELLVVIVIVAILAAFIVPNMVAAPMRARDRQRKESLSSIQLALEKFAADKDFYPPGNYASIKTALIPEYAKSLPQDPKPGRDFTYLPTGCSEDRCSGYVISVALENAKDSKVNVAPNIYQIKSEALPIY